MWIWQTGWIVHFADPKIACLGNFAVAREVLVGWRALGGGRHEEHFRVLAIDVQLRVLPISVS